MKTLIAVHAAIRRNRQFQRNLLILLRFVGILTTLIAVYTVAFHIIMIWEGRAGQHSWFSGLYWTLVTMSTLGFGDITFHSDLGRLFSAVVLISGILFLLVMLPFTFIQFFYAPWMETQARLRAPREAAADLSGHVIITHPDPVSLNLVRKLNQYHRPHLLVVPTSDEALRWHDQGYTVMVGDLDHPDTYRRARATHAALVATTGPDPFNTNVAFTVRSVAETVPVIGTANDADAVDILGLAGCTHVLRLGAMMGKALARRTHGGDRVTHIIGRFDELLIAEATVAGTPLVGKTLAASGLRQQLGVTVVGVWERGAFQTAGPHTPITQHTVLVLAGSREQLDGYDRQYSRFNREETPVIVIGAGRVGRATARALHDQGLEYRVIEENPQRIIDPDTYVLGNAANREVLEQAGIDKAHTVILTTHSDDINIYLTLYCRRLRPDIQIITRSVLERNVPTLHRAGADFVLSYASMGANAIFNLLQQGDVLMVAEGLDVFKVPVPASLAGVSLSNSSIRPETGCSVIAVRENGETRINPNPADPLPQSGELVLIGTNEAENRFMARYSG
jgi:Trk K+ transport system NAD-binding subunit